MCGIVGVVGLIDEKAKKAFKNMLLIDVLRGAHSTGLAATTRYGVTGINKKAMLPSDFLELKRTNSLLNNSLNCALIGHNRYATVGAVTNNTAHPFECGNVIGVHNGTLSTRSKLIDKEQYAVDSENLYHHMDVKGLQSVFDAMSFGFNNAWSLVWVNQEEHTINFLRNEKRPMHYALSKDGKTLFYASEWWMLHGCLSRNDIEYQEVFSTTVDYHYKIKLPKANEKDYQIVITKTKLEETPQKKVEPTKNVGNVTRIHSGNSMHNNHNKSKVSDFKKLRETYTGTSVDFYVSAEPTKQNQYFVFECSDDPSIEGRLYLTKTDCINNKAKSELYNLLMTSVNYFSAQCTKVVYNKGEHYLKLDWRTLSEYPFTLDEDDDTGNTKDLGDCAFCSDPLVEGQFHNATSGDAAFCLHCLKDKLVFLTIQNMGYDFDANFDD